MRALGAVTRAVAEYPAGARMDPARRVALTYCPELVADTPAVPADICPVYLTIIEPMSAMIADRILRDAFQATIRRVLRWRMADFAEDADLAHRNFGKVARAIADAAQDCDIQAIFLTFTALPSEPRLK